MPSYFIDSSSLVKRYVAEAGTERVVGLVEGPHRIMVSRLAFVEVTSAVCRRARASNASPDDVDEVLDALDREFRGRFEVIDLGSPVMSKAADLIRAHGVRAPDGVQLACAVLARGGEPSEPGEQFTFVCSDHELNFAAEAESLTVWDPAAG